MTVAITRMERTAAELRQHAARSAATSVARRLLALALVLDGHKREAWRARRHGRGRLAWTGKPCATGCTATTRMALQAWATGTVVAPNPGSRPSRRRRSRAGYAPGRMSKQTASYAGAVWTSRRGSRVRSAHGATGRRLARAQRGQASASAPVCPRVHAPAPSQGGCRGAGVFRSGFAAFVTAVLPEAVRVAKTELAQEI